MNLKSIPKVELHRHLELSMRHDTMCELALQVGLSIPDDKAFTEHFLITTPMEGLGTVLNKFLNTQKLLFSEDVLERITYEIIEDAFYEGIKILELRYSPTFIRQGHEHLSFDKIHQSIYKGLQRGEKKFPIAVGLICIIQRIRPVSEAQYVADFAIAHKDSLIGLDLADNEIGFDPRPFSSLFLKAKNEGLGITVHSGEADIPQAVSYVQEAIDYLGADRVGHGVQIYRSSEMMDSVKRQGVVLELCPTSNWITKAVSTKEEHPFRQLFEYGIKTTLNSDDPGIFNINLTHEYQFLAELHNFTENEFSRCNDYAASASFIALEKKEAIWPRPIL